MSLSKADQQESLGVSTKEGLWSAQKRTIGWGGLESGPYFSISTFCDRYDLSRFVELAIHFDVMSLMIGHCVRIGDGADLAALVGTTTSLAPLARCSLLEQFFSPWAAHLESEIPPFTVAAFWME